MTDGTGLSYRAAGVDRDTANRAKDRILELLAATATPGVVPNAGGFGGLFRVPGGYRNALMVASADGVGTKLKVAAAADRHSGVGLDIVNHCANDILVEGARPLFFLDYIGMGRLEAGTVEQIVEGVAAACTACGCALLGGETAEMPDVYSPGEYDLAGFIVGMVEEDLRPGAHRVTAGDALVALAADGFHTNGFSLLRRLLFDRLGLGVHDAWPGLDASIADVLLRPHRGYGPALLPLLDNGAIHALSHITGGGVPENLDRMIPDGLSAIVDRATWTPPPEFLTVAAHGGVADREMFRTFNMGVGMVAVVARDAAGGVIEQLQAVGETAWSIGEVRRGTAKVVLEGGPGDS